MPDLALRGSWASLRKKLAQGRASVCERAAKLRVWQYEEAPIEWLHALNRSRGLLSLGLWGVLSVSVALPEPLMDWTCLAFEGRCTIERTASWDAWHVGVGLVELIAMPVMMCWDVKPRMFEFLLCFFHMSSVTVSSLTLTSAWQYTLYSGAGLPFFTFCLALSGVRALPFILSVVFDVALLVFHSWVAGWIRRPPFGLFVGIVCSLGLVVAEQIHWKAMHQSELEVKAEKEAMEALLSTVCDAGCWIAADGDTVLRGEGRLDHIMGMEMEGTKLSERLDHEDQDRLRHATVGTTSKALQDLVRLLPVTFRRPGATTVDMELFIVDRRGVFAQTVARAAPGSPSRRGFLIGFRISMRQGSETQIQDDLEEGGLVRELTSIANDEAGIGQGESQRTLDAATPLNRGPSSAISASVASVPATLASVHLRAPEMHRCTKADLEATIKCDSGRIRLPLDDRRPHERATALEVLSLITEHARGGALVCIATAAAFTQVFGLAERMGEQPKPGLRVADKRYMTDRLRGVHISDPYFAQTFMEFTEHSANDRWPDDHPDQRARGQPKDGAFLISTSGYRLKCAVKLLGLPPPMHWDSVGTKHETAMACAWAVKGAQVFVRSDAGTVHYLVRGGDTLHVCKLELERSQF